METYLAPENFALVENGVYRSSFPRTKNCLFLQKLGLKSVISLVPEDYPKAMCDFYDANGITLICHGLDGNKWPFKAIDLIALRDVLVDILNPENRPLLIHCNKGKHRTGTVIGSLRKLRGWAYSSIFQEYILYATPKVRAEDQMMIEYFEFTPPSPKEVSAEGEDGDESKEKKKKKKDKEKEKGKDKDETVTEDGEDTKEKKKEKSKDKDKEKEKEKELEKKEII